MVHIFKKKSLKECRGKNLEKDEKEGWLTDIRSSVNVMEQDDGNFGESIQEQG